MSDELREDLKGSIFPPNYVSRGGGTEVAYIDRLHRIFAAARRWLNLTSPETIEKAQEAAFAAFDKGIKMKGLDWPDITSRIAEAVLRSVAGSEEQS